MTITIMGCVIFSLDICQFEFFNSDLVPHQWNSSLFWTSNHRDHPKRSHATAGNTRPTNFHQHQIVSDRSKRLDVTAGIAIRALSSCTSTIWERDPKVLLAPCSMENVFTYRLHKPFQWCISLLHDVYVRFTGTNCLPTATLRIPTSTTAIPSLWATTTNSTGANMI